MPYGRAGVLSVLAAVIALSPPARAQSVISAHSGVIYYFEGAVYLGDQRLEPHLDMGGQPADHGVLERQLLADRRQRVADQCQLERGHRGGGDHQRDGLQRQLQRFERHAHGVLRERHALPLD